MQKNGKKAFKKKTFRKHKPTVQGLAKSIRKIQKDEELKHCDYSLDVTSVVDTGRFDNLFFAQQNDSATGRTANEVSPTSLQIRLALIHDPLYPGPTAFRHIIFWDSQANGAMPTLGDLLDVNTAFYYTTCPYNRSNSSRFRILMDKFIDIGPLAQYTSPTTDFVSDMKVYKKKIKLSRIIKFSGNAGTIADIRTNSLISFMITDVPVAATHGPLVTFTTRVYYKDD